MDSRLLNPTFLSNNLDYVQKQAAKEGKSVTIVKDSTGIPGIGITIKVQDLTEGGV